MKHTLLLLLSMASALFAVEVPLLKYRLAMEVPDECATAQTWGYRFDWRGSESHLLTIRDAGSEYRVKLTFYVLAEAAGADFTAKAEGRLQELFSGRVGETGAVDGRVVYAFVKDGTVPAEPKSPFAAAFIRTQEGLMLKAEFVFEKEAPEHIQACRDVVLGVIRSFKDGPRAENVQARTAHLELRGWGFKYLSVDLPEGYAAVSTRAERESVHLVRIPQDGARGCSIGIGLMALGGGDRKRPRMVYEEAAPEFSRRAGTLAGEPVEWMVADWSRSRRLARPGWTAEGALPLKDEEEAALHVIIEAPDEASFHEAMEMMAGARWSTGRSTNFPDGLPEGASPFDPPHGAAWIGDPAALARVLEQGADVNTAGMHGEMPLHAAAKAGDTACMELLLEHGASPTARDASGRMPLAFAAGSGNVEAARLLLEHGAEVDAADWRGRTALYFAASEGKVDMIEFLLEQGADVSTRDSDLWTPLHAAVLFGRNEAARCLLEHGADANAKACDLFHYHPEFDTPLGIAVDKAYAPMVRLLLQYGANPDVPAMDGTPLIRHAEKELSHADSAETADALRTILQLLQTANHPPAQKQ